MNLESASSPKNKAPAVDLDLEEFDFKPITSGLGFNHQQKTTEVKPIFTERTVPMKEVSASRPQTAARKEMNVYQNDLSLFYGQTEAKPAPVTEERTEIVYKTAAKVDRIVAYILDVALLGSALSVTLMFMSRALGMEILEAWAQYPDEITPLILTLFCGFYLLYFSISEKSGTTLGKSLMNIRVVNEDYQNQSFTILLARTSITLLNFASLGLFSYFDLQNKVTNSKVIKAD